MKRHRVGKGKRRGFMRTVLSEKLAQWQDSSTPGGRSIAHVASYLYGGHEPEREHVLNAAADLERYIPGAERGEHGWTPKDADDLRRMVSSLHEMAGVS